MKDKKTSSMRYGYTTGSCATASAKAALLSLILQKEQSEVAIRLPIGKNVTFSLENCEFTRDTARAGVIKDGGDDPDATHGALILATVNWKDEPGIEIDGGPGVGRVTKPGLPVSVGEAAINPVPRKMIRETLQSVLENHQLKRGVRVAISVPRGEEIAKKTLNHRLGIVCGISILGTRGTVVPFSTAAYKASIVQAIRVARECGCEHLVLSTGGRSEKTGMEIYPDLPEEAFIEMGDFVGFSLVQCKNFKIKRVSLIGMMGKFSKLAYGVMMVHSKSSSVNFDFLAEVARDSGVSDSLVEEIRQANTASQVGNLMHKHHYQDFFDKLCTYCCQSGLKEVKGGMEIETVICSMKGAILGRVSLDE